MQQPKGNSVYTDYYHPKHQHHSKSEFYFMGDQSQYIRKFMQEFSLSNLRDCIHFVTQFYTETTPPVKIYRFEKASIINMKATQLRWRCDLDNEHDVQAMRVVNKLFEDTDVMTNRQSVFYCILVAVWKNLRDLKRNNTTEFNSVVQKKVYNIGGVKFDKLKVGQYIEYKGTEKEAKEKVSDWMVKNYETLRQYIVINENNKILIYREL